MLNEKVWSGKVDNDSGLPWSMSTSLTVVRRDIEAVFTFHLVVQSSAFGKYDLGVPGLAVEQNNFERQVGSPFVHGVPTYLV